MDRAGGSGLAARPQQKPVQDMLAVLRLDDGILHHTDVAAGGLEPLAAAAADVPAFHLNNRHADAAPGHDQVGLVLGAALDHRHRVQERRIVGKLLAQHLPDPPLGRPANAELGLRRMTSRRHGRIVPHSAERGPPRRRPELSLARCSWR